MTFYFSVLCLHNTFDQRNGGSAGDDTSLFVLDLELPRDLWCKSGKLEDLFSALRPTLK